MLLRDGNFSARVHIVREFLVKRRLITLFEFRRCRASSSHYIAEGRNCVARERQSLNNFSFWTIDFTSGSADVLCALSPMSPVRRDCFLGFIFVAP